MNEKLITLDALLKSMSALKDYVDASTKGINIVTSESTEESNDANIYSSLMVDLKIQSAITDAINGILEEEF